ncbi:MAG: hypothetical protein R3D63_09640 [Paracoccaceae bacterium]
MLLALLVLLAGPVLPVQAGTFSDLVMAPGLLVAAPTGTVARYSMTRHLPAHAETAGTAAEVRPLVPVVDGRLELAVVENGGGRHLALRRDMNGKAEPEITFPADGPNPVLLYFLENVVRGIASETGGSPFYIRNRIREVLAAAGIPAGQGPQQVILQPFAQDPNRDRMGIYGDLTLSISVDPARPDRILALSADTAAGDSGYSEHLLLVPGE